MAQDIFDFVCIAIQRLVVQAFVHQFNGCILHTVYNVVLVLVQIWVLYVVHNLRTYYLPFIQSLCILKHQKHNVLNSSSVYIRNRVYFRYEAALLYRLPSNPCDSFFFRFLAFFFFAFVGRFSDDVLMLKLKRIQQTTREEKGETKWNGKICILNRCVVFFFYLFSVYRINVCSVAHFSKWCCLLMMFSLLYLTSIFYPFHKLILLSELIWFLFLKFVSFHFSALLIQYNMQYANGWVSFIFPSGVLWILFSFYFVRFLSYFDFRLSFRFRF